MSTVYPGRPFLKAVRLMWSVLSAACGIFDDILSIHSITPNTIARRRRTKNIGFKIILHFFRLRLGWTCFWMNGFYYISARIDIMTYGLVLYYKIFLIARYLNCNRCLKYEILSVRYIHFSTVLLCYDIGDIFKSGPFIAASVMNHPTLKDFNWAEIEYLRKAAVKRTS